MAALIVIEVRIRTSGVYQLDALDKPVRGSVPFRKSDGDSDLEKLDSYRNSSIDKTVT